MRLAIDSYCYHRYFGEAYPEIQTDPGRRMTIWDFLLRARKHGVQGVSIESCFFPQITDKLLDELRERLDDMNFERAWAWGHPDGLRSGADRAAANDLVAHLAHAERIGAKVMRIVGGSRRTRPAKWTDHRRQLARLLKQIVKPAGDRGIALAVENHIDLYAAELVELLEQVDSPWLGVNLDTANNLRLGEDPVEVAKLLAPWTRATHIKDVVLVRGNPKEFRTWPSVPLGQGVVDLQAILRELKRTRYNGLLAVEVDYLHPAHGEEDRAVAKSVKYLRSLLEKIA